MKKVTLNEIVAGLYSTTLDKADSLLEKQGGKSSKSFRNQRDKADYLGRLLTAIDGTSEVELTANRKTFNMGEIAELAIKEMLNKNVQMSGLNETDLTYRNKRYEIKFVQKASSSEASELADGTEDLLIASNVGHFLLSREVVNNLDESYFKKGTKRLKPSIINHPECKQNQVTKRLDSLMGF